MTAFVSVPVPIEYNRTLNGEFVSNIRHEDFFRPFVALILPPLKSETGWTGELWSNRFLLILEN